MSWVQNTQTACPRHRYVLVGVLQIGVLYISLSWNDLRFESIGKLLILCIASQGGGLDQNLPIGSTSI